MNYPPQAPLPPTQSPNIILAVASVILGAIGLLGMIPTLIFTLCGIIPIGFGIAAALYFNTVFFPANDPLSGTLLSFATLFPISLGLMTRSPGRRAPRRRR